MRALCVVCSQAFVLVSSNTSGSSCIAACRIDACRYRSPLRALIDYFTTRRRMAARSRMRVYGWLWLYTSESYVPS